MYAVHISLVLSMIVAITSGDYECLCNYAVQHNILSETDPIAAVTGELFEFDCKPTYRLGPNIPNWLAIQFNNKVGYVQLNDKTKVQTCPGQPSKSDIVIETTTVESTTLTTVTPTVSSFPPTSLASTPSSTIKVTSDQTSPSTAKSTNLTTSILPYLIVTNNTAQRSTRTTLPIITSTTPRITYPTTTATFSTTMPTTDYSSSFSTSTTTPYPTTTKTTKPTTTPTTQEQTTTSTTTGVPTTTARITPYSSTLTTSMMLPATSSAKLTTITDRTTTSSTGTTPNRVTTISQTITTSKPTTHPMTMMKLTTKLPTPSTTLMTSSTAKPSTTTTVASTTPWQPHCPPQVLSHHRATVEANGRCYEFIKTPHKTWPEAEHDCNTRGGHLVSINSRAEQNLVYTELWRKGFNRDDKHVWIGLTDKDSEGHWRWSSGEPLTFTFWNKGENHGFFEDCALLDMDSLSHWKDYPCTGFLFSHQTHGYVCEYNLL